MGVLLGLISYILRKLWQSQPNYSPRKVITFQFFSSCFYGCISKTEPRGSKINREWSSALGCNVGVPQGFILGPRLFSLNTNNSLKLAEELISKYMQMTLLFMPQQAATWKRDDRHVATCQTMSSNVESVKWPGEWNAPDWKDLVKSLFPSHEIQSHNNYACQR